MTRKLFLIGLLFLSTLVTLSAADGIFQINTVFQHTSYPLFGTGGKDIIRQSSAGIGLKSTRGSGFHGTIDLAILFPYKLEEKTYPAASFTDRTITGFPIVLDSVLGIGYMFDLSPMVFLVSTGFHAGAMMEGGAYLMAFGLGLDAQSFVKLGKVITAQLGLKLALDFWGMQTFVPGSNEFSGFPFTFGMYTGIGLSY